MRMAIFNGWLVGTALALACPSVAVTSSPELTKPKQPTANPQFIRPRVLCPANPETLTQAMLRDLPSYMNRQYIRTIARRVEGANYAIVASQPDFIPLPAESSEYPNPIDKNLHQIFFTVLERKYSGQSLVEFQHYHWLFLTQTTDGWQLALMFSRFGRYPDGNQPLTPPKDSSQSLTAQAIRTWLRDCAAGAVKL